jgi:hypothetical protein
MALLPASSMATTFSAFASSRAVARSRASGLWLSGLGAACVFAACDLAVSLSLSLRGSFSGGPQRLARRMKRTWPFGRCFSI